jgi:hypothetical protein
MMKLLSQINYVFCGRTNAEHARLVLEGYAVHDRVGRHAREFMALATEVLEKLLDLRSTSTLVDEAGSAATVAAFWVDLLAASDSLSDALLEPPIESISY